VINLSPFPNANEFTVFSSQSWDKVTAKLSEAHEAATSKHDFWKRLYDIFHCGDTASFLFCECAQCGRLYVFRRANDTAPAFTYMPDHSIRTPVLLRDLAAHPTPPT
jgi:hypothetical protein